METIAGANRGGVVGCSAFRRESIPVVSGRANLVQPGRNYLVGSRRGGFQTMRQSLFSSDSFQDQSHVQFYINDKKSGRKEKLANSVVHRAVGRGEEAVDSGSWKDVERDNKGLMKAKKKQLKKMQKKLRKVERDAAGATSSSSSSSSSESEAGAATERRARTRRTLMEKLRRDWDCISQDPLMNSIPVISSKFMMEQPQAQQQVATPVRNSSAGPEAKVASCSVESEVLNRVMASRISSSVDTSTSMSANEKSFSSPMAGVIDPRQRSAVASRVEVCMGGKCKAAGAQSVLSAFQANGVTASPCNKCMKKCKLAVNAKVHQDDDDFPQMYSGIRVEDVNALSQKHFGAGSASRAAPDWFSSSFGAVQV